MKKDDKEIKVLQVEDDEDQAEIMKIILEKLNPKIGVETVKNGSECLEKIEQNRYSIILLDYLLPNMNGIEVLKKMKEMEYDVPVVVITGYGDAQIEKEVTEYGAASYVVKKRVDYLKTTYNVIMDIIENKK